MRYFKFDLKGMVKLCCNGLRDYSYTNEPTLISIGYKTLPIVTLFFMSPKNHIWSTYPPQRSCSVLEQFSDDEAEQALMHELLESGIDEPLPEGILSLADDLQMSNDQEWGKFWGISLDVNISDEDKWIKYLYQWWDQLNFYALINIDDDVVMHKKWWAERSDLLRNSLKCSAIDVRKYDIPYSLLTRLWWVLDDYSVPSSNLMQKNFNEFIDRASLGEKLLNNTLQVCGGYYLGKVCRDTVISSCKPNKKLQSSAHYFDLVTELSHRDKLFALQCEFVNLLDQVSFYSSCQNAIDLYEKSIQSTPSKEFGEYSALGELENYIKRMGERYPILVNPSL